MANRSREHLDRFTRTRAIGRRPTPGALALRLLPALGFVLGCGDSSTEPSASPARLAALSPAVDTVVAGESADPPIAVRVESGADRPVEGIPVRFRLLTRDAGSVEAMAVSDREGIAEAEFDAGREPLEATIRVDVPSATQVTPVLFTIVVVPATTVDLVAVEGDGQRAEVGSQLPLPFAVRATTPGGAPAGGLPIAWSLDGGSETARLDHDTTFTDENGRARALLTLGSEAREHVVLARAAGGVASDTLRFRALAVERIESPLRVDSVRPLPLTAGEEAVAFGSGFQSVSGDLEVRVEGDPGTVLEVGPERVRFIVPEFAERCLPAREVGVRVLAEGTSSNGDLVDLRPGQPALELVPGEAVRLRGPDLSCFQLPGAEEAREFWVVVQSAGRTPGARSAVRLTARAGDRIGLGDPPASPALHGVGPAVRSLAAEADRGEDRLREAVRREVRARGLVPARSEASGTPGPRSVVGAGTVPTPGDTLSLRFAVGPELGASCADTTNVVQGVVRGVGEHHVLVVDARAPDAGMPEEELAALAREFDELAFPVDTAYFGTPADLDANGRVVLLFTPEVNALTPPGSQTFIGGFFLALDLADSGGGGGVADGGVCPASNEAEILYMSVADPEGRFGDPITVSQTRRLVRELFPHELQHLINAERRVLVDPAGFDALEETWLDEGLSHIAEEVAGLELLGLERRRNLGFEDVTAARAELDAFNAFHIQNFFNLSLFMLDPAGSPTLAAVDPGGLASLQVRGFGWILLRWLADHEAGADERPLFRSLAGGGPTRAQGIANVERTVGDAWEDLIADLLSALAVDDVDPDPRAERLRIPTWNLRDVYASLNGNPSARGRFPLPFPLAFQRLDFASRAVDLELNASAAAYFRLESGRTTPPLAVRLGSPAGGPPSTGAAAQITIVRTR